VFSGKIVGLVWESGSVGISELTAHLNLEGDPKVRECVSVFERLLWAISLLHV
jgi:hypothetical protein